MLISLLINCKIKILYKLPLIVMKTMKNKLIIKANQIKTTKIRQLNGRLLENLMVLIK